MIQEIEGEEDVIIFKETPDACTASIRRKFWPRRWDIYLHSVEYLELEYKKKWFWRDVRETMKKNEWQIVGQPIASVHFYEPQLDVDITYDPVPNPLNTWKDIDVNRLEEEMPGYIPRDNPTTLEDLARMAFPASKEEKKEKKAQLKKRKLEHHLMKPRQRMAFAKKAPVKKASMGKAPARKSSVKRSPARRAPSRKR